MVYNEPKAPESHHVVTVKVVEVTPAWVAGSGGSAVRHERSVEDHLTFSVRADEYGEALDLALVHLKAAGAKG